MCIYSNHILQKTLKFCTPRYNQEDMTDSAETKSQMTKIEGLLG